MADSWIEIPSDSDFSLANIPFGVFRPRGKKLDFRLGTRVGDWVLDLAALEREGYLGGLNLPSSTLSAESLNSFIALGKGITKKVRTRLQELLSRENSSESGLEKDLQTQKKAFFKADEVEMKVPVEVGDYTDFYSSKEHATNVGSLFRDPKNALLPNWKHLPVAYHGRSSSLIVSEDSVYRPWGQYKNKDSDLPVFGPSRQIDFELETAFIIGKETQRGYPVPVDEAEDYIFGMVLLNDWSARDIQAWEYVPLGPFLGKNFASSVSPWVITLEALSPFQTEAPPQDPPILDYLKEKQRYSYDISLQIELKPEGDEALEISKTKFQNLYWTQAQQLAHHTINGCNIRVGDLYASGTISGSSRDSFGSLLELCWKGTRPIRWPSGEERCFLEDGDRVIMRGWGEKDRSRVGFGELSGTILPSPVPSFRG
ncbi:MAG: fumarylacetoacetase [Cytophagales bacterium]|nr:fumarylacetoacetase [Cytophagales bacterium]